ncbi:MULTISPECIES: 4'-phosphopantetheinyl transferase family protein [Kitasatospora]|uniref:Putative phosphopantetheinyl transferase n=1 Tax=Kitasatospora setae (strain ATCC 33774 / DSM 43861 / JCM 3304 / KCC A-0304 / NBRC 14216 / KM-6054) TaxID=452652 RepID=E4N4U4_KITSK|nr:MULTISPECIES: 4'-phosphopantetheinyl transferase family protein [Kitasatospora]BAJ26225.1 putative phosphopantetheinyl transferase [Kitasatospora setae KM-6054]
MSAPVPALSGARRRRLPTAAGPVDLWWHVSPGPAPVRGRALLQHAVGARRGRPAAEVAVLRDPLGRPVPAPDRFPPLCLSAAHSGPVTVAAVLAAPRPGTLLGIDVEHLAAPPSAQLLDLALTAAERAALAELPPALRLPRFLALWTAKEAVAKALGWPLLRALTDVELVLRPRPAVARLGRNRAPAGWQLLPLRLPGRPHTATLALYQPPATPPPPPRREHRPWTSPEASP